jgi:glycosyltransferase involved in cell wall biosynthesis
MAPIWNWLAAWFRLKPRLAPPSARVRAPFVMKIVYLAAGAAGMYCGSCLHDNTLAAALRARGEDILLVPTYTPLRTDEENVSDSHLFFGGINVYLQQKSALFRHTPWFLDALLDQPSILNWATKGGPSVDAKKLGDMVVSMLQGEEGRQRKEIRKLMRWLDREARPDVVHLSNAMFVGMAREIRKLGIPVISTLSGEDLFLEQLVEPFYSQARAAIVERAKDIEAFVALNHYYADFMSQYAQIPRHLIHVIPHGLNLNGYEATPADTARPLTIGYLARICPEKGLHNLIAAAELLLKDPSVPPFRLRAAGYLGTIDRPYLETIVQRTASWPDPGRFEYVGELDRAGKISFFQSLDVMSLPTVYRESKGIPAIEALACGVPVVLPNHGAFPELIERTAGGLLHHPTQPESLAAELKSLLQDPQRARELGQRGKNIIHRDYHAAGMAEATLRLYEQVTKKEGRG